MHYFLLLVLGTLHGIVDCCVTMVPPLWLPLKTTFSLKPEITGIIIAAIQIPASIGQTIFGILADKFTTRWMVVVAAAMAVLGIGLAGLFTNLFMVIALLAMSAIGVGLFHPEAVTLANRLAGQQHPRGISIFLGCGFLGQAIGPVWISHVVDPEQGRTLADTWRTLPIGLTIVAIAATATVWLPTGLDGTKRGKAIPAGQPGPRSKVLRLLVLMSITKSMGLMMILYTLPQFLGEQLRIGWWMGAYIAAQGVGILFGGLTIPDRLQRFMLVMSLVASLVPASLLVITTGVAWVEPALLCVFGMCVSWAIPTTIQLGQAVAPGRERLASGLMIGFSWGTAMLVTAPLSGWLSKLPSATALAYGVAVLFTILSLGCAAVLPTQAELTRLKQLA